MEQKEFWALNALRFVLALYLVFFHTLTKQHYPVLAGTLTEAVVDLGNLATTVFFVLSGFLLTHAYIIRKKGRALNKKQFIVARISSLYPLHIIGFMLAMITTLAKIYVGGGVTVIVEPFSSQVRTLDTAEVLYAIFANLALLNAWNPYYLIINGPSWSLSALAFYYFVFIAISPKIFNLKKPGFYLVLLGIIFAVPGILADILHRTDMLTEGLLHRNPIVRLPLFLSGMVLCVIFSRRPVISLARREQYMLGLIVIITFLASAYMRFHEMHQLHVIRNGLYLPAALALVWMGASITMSVSQNVRHWSARLGGASLAMFLLHLPTYNLFMMAEKIALNVLYSEQGTSLTSMILSARDTEQSLFVFPAYLFLLFFVCIYANERIAMPAKRKIQDRFSKDVAPEPIMPMRSTPPESSRNKYAP